MTHCPLNHYDHHRATLVSHIAHLNLLTFQIVTKFCAHLHDVQQGGLKWLRKS
jgi:hypothetical protein